MKLGCNLQASSVWSEQQTDNLGHFGWKFNTVKHIFSLSCGIIDLQLDLSGITFLHLIEPGYHRQHLLYTSNRRTLHSARTDIIFSDRMC